MDELSPLFQDIEFRERLRGYDVDEVDAYIDRVARAAALVQGRIAELQQRVEAAEARQAPTPAHAEADESMSRILTLAQRTADAAIAEAEAEAAELLAGARTEAAATRADADDYASRVLAEAETGRRRAIVDAESAAAEAIAHERERVSGAIAELEQYRAFLTEDIDILERHLTESRSALATSLSGLADLLDTPEAFRAPAMPATSGALAPAVLHDFVAQPADPELESDAGLTEIDAAALDAAELDEAALGDAALDDVELDVAALGDAGAEVPADPEQPAVVAAEVAVPDEAIDLTEQPAAPGADVEAHEPVFEPTPVPEVDAAWSAPVEALQPSTADPEPRDPFAAFDLPDESSDEGLPTEAVPVVTESAAALVDDAVGAPLVDAVSDNDIDLTDPAIDLAAPAEPAPVEPPLLVTAADLDTSEAGDEWVQELHVESGPITEPVPMVADQLLFDEPTPATAADPFLEQLREAVAREDSDEFGDDALAAFFDSEADDGGRSWFPKRR